MTTESIEAHYEKIWMQPAKASLTLATGPVMQLPPGFRVLEFLPTNKRRMWTYATCGMSCQGDAVAIELHLFSPVQSSQHVELLTAIAHYHVTGEYLNLGHTVYFGRPWLPGSECDYGFVSLPYLDGPTLEWSKIEGREVRFLWLIPITYAEREFARQHGIEALEAKFDAASFNYLDTHRKSVV